MILTRNLARILFVGTALTAIVVSSMGKEFVSDVDVGEITPVEVSEQYCANGAVTSFLIEGN